MTVNARKLIDELMAAGIPCFGCNSDGSVFFDASATAADRTAAASILAAHDPSPTNAQQLAGLGISRELAALAVRLSSSWATASQAQRDRVQGVLDAAGFKVLNLL